MMIMSDYAKKYNIPLYVVKEAAATLPNRNYFEEWQIRNALNTHLWKKMEYYKERIDNIFGCLRRMESKDMIDMPVTELLAGLAEESAELSQAALKLRRALDGTNPTPKSEDEAYENLCEEIADVILYLQQIPYNRVYVRQIQERKEKRWKERLSAKKSNTP